MRTARAIAIAALVPSLLSTSPATAAPARQVSAPASVTVANMSFAPSRATVAVGETVTWTFMDPTSHTATSDQGFFDTGLASGGEQRAVRFRSSGTYAYHCVPHPHMTGRVLVPVKVSGSRADGWRLRWLVGDNPRGRSYDVQVRRQGTSTWTSLRRGTTASTARFFRSSGIWQVRARTHQKTATSGWSPAVSLS